MRPHADLSVDTCARYYVVNKSSLYSWRGVTLCSSLFATLSLSLKRYYHRPLYHPASFLSMGTCLAVSSPWWLEGPASLFRGHAHNHSPSRIAKYLSNRPWTKCWSPQRCYAWLHACNNPSVLYTQPFGMNKPNCIVCWSPAEVAPYIIEKCSVQYFLVYMKIYQKTFCTDLSLYVLYLCIW